MFNNATTTMMVNFIDENTDQNIIPSRSYMVGEHLSYLPKNGDLLTVEIDIDTQLPVSLSINNARFFAKENTHAQIPSKCYIVNHIETTLMINEALDNINYILEELSFVDAKEIFYSCR